MHLLLAELTAKRPVLLDGAWGTELQKRGLPIGACPDGWNLEAAEQVEAVARDYVDAGSRVILTNTFGANRFTLKKSQLAERVVAINRRGVEISLRAAGGRSKVFASMGPSGVMLMMGTVTAEELSAAFAEQAQAIADAGAHGIVVETMSDPGEAVLAVKAAKATGLPVVACMTFDTGPNRDRTMMGTTPEQAAVQLADAGADAIGANCGQGPSGFVAICRRLKATTNLPVWIKSNAGLPQLVDGFAAYTTTPEDFAEQAMTIVAEGADFIGGCCGTSPAYIRALAAKLAAR